MGSFSTFLFIYILGGVTFIPLLLFLVLLYAYLMLPQSSAQKEDTDAKDILLRRTDDQYSLKSGTDVLAEKLQCAHDSDVAAGYFAVFREYMPDWIDGKLPEMTTPTGEMVAAESPSVYQTMYRSIFDWKQSSVKGNGKGVKRTRNVFFIVLRHGHLILYDDSEQIEVRYVISLAHHNVSIYGGGSEIPEGELWIKRNAICLTRRQDSIADLRGSTQPFYLFSGNMSEKEDFYFALLKNQEKISNLWNRPPKHQNYDVKHMTILIQRLHSTEEQLQTQWINAILGRLFLALYKTPEMEQFIRKKITKKISRVKKPNFITKLELQKVDIGEGAPFVTKPRLKNLTIDGDCTIEADVNYSGNFRLEISATARIDLGTRLKAREVDLILAVMLKKLDGHCLVRLKPPPSNRIWFSFETMPDIVMAIEPIVSSMQITYGIVLRAIESRVREVFAETLVLPFWDDIPFFDTSSQLFRGGIWQQDNLQQKCRTEVPDKFEVLTEAVSVVERNSVEIVRKDDRAISTPMSLESPPAVLRSRSGSKSSILKSWTDENAISSATEEISNPNPPRTIRSQTFSNAADPVVTASHVNKMIFESKNAERKNAISTTFEISGRSHPILPIGTLLSSPRTAEDHTARIRTLHSCDLYFTDPAHSEDNGKSSPDVPRMTFSVPAGVDFATLEDSERSSGTSFSSQEPRRRSSLETTTFSPTFSRSLEEKPKRTESIGHAATVVKRWVWDVLGKKDQIKGKGLDTSGQSSTPEDAIGS